ncbi:carbon monoxide dehydrogenase [Bacillus salipaludis]|uniref:Carbon monoxide dehydrogenase n=1 Tax=Bacillus salipaludis TaxID=2547811 RepID=A0AA90TWK2_9BACI|nr:carbon monoxide dehydrogenase [Bacillus salipaludis]MDQ6600813.1 carbon monoxide dehydrogenase [Bacillus salipaludis]
MSKRINFICLILCIACFVPINEIAFASPKDTPPSFEEKFTDVGYKPVKDAVKEFENHFKQDMKFPKIKPSISFTHEFGRFYEDKEYDTNDFLSIRFVNEKSSENNYKIDIRPLKNKVVFKDKVNQKVYTLQNGQKAIYTDNTPIMNFLVFEKDNWQYMLGIDKKVTNKVTPEILVKIANSTD